MQPIYDATWRKALELADGQRSRLQPQPDGAVVVVNFPGFVWPPVARPEPKRRKRTAKR